MMGQKSYKGYIVLLRGILLCFVNQPRFAEFGAFIAIVIECDWDKRHSTYGCLTKSDGELASKWGCNVSTIWRHKKKLLQMGLLVHQDHLVKVKNFDWFEAPFVKQLAKTPIATTQDLIAKSQELIADMQENVAIVQRPQDHNQPQSFNVSSKGNLSLSNNDNDFISDEELDHIAKEIDKKEGK